MATMNHVALAGNLTRDPEVRQLQSGTTVADIGLAVSDTYRNKSGEKVDSTCFVDITAWGSQAEFCAQHLAKGAPVLVEGKLKFDQWQAKDGSKQSKLRVRADRVQGLAKAAGDCSQAQ